MSFRAPRVSSDDKQPPHSESGSSTRKHCCRNPGGEKGGRFGNEEQDNQELEK